MPIPRYHDEPKQEIGDVISRLQNGDYFLINSPDQINVLAQFGKLNTLAGLLNHDPEWHTLISLAMRPGAALFWQVLEHTYFPPYSSRENFFLFGFAQWQDMIWTIGIIPARSFFLLDVVASRTNMRIADGIPMIFTHEGKFTFPITRAHTLENANDPNLPHYRESVETLQKVARGEMTPDAMYASIREATRTMYRQESEDLKDFLQSKGVSTEGI